MGDVQNGLEAVRANIDHVRVHDLALVRVQVALCYHVVVAPCRLDHVHDQKIVALTIHVADLVHVQDRETGCVASIVAGAGVVAVTNVALIIVLDFKHTMEAVEDEDEAIIVETTDVSSLTGETIDQGVVGHSDQGEVDVDDHSGVVDTETSVTVVEADILDRAVQIAVNAHALTAPTVAEIKIGIAIPDTLSVAVIVVKENMKRKGLSTAKNMMVNGLMVQSQKDHHRKKKGPSL